MKRRSSLRNLLIVFSLCTVFAQHSFAQNTVPIPDPQLAGWFQQIFPTCMSGNMLDTTCSNVVNTQYLSVANKNITNFEGIQYFRNLKRLILSDNLATSVPGWANTLEEIIAEDVPLTSLPTLPDSLLELQLDNNNLTSLPALPPKLWNLRCDRNYLTSLPALPASLLALYIQHNQLSSVPPLPNGLSTLVLYNNQLTALPATLPPNLGHLDVSSNSISSLPPLPNTLNHLSFHNNNISTVPASWPPNLVLLDCGANNISNMPPIPATVWQLYCGSNNLTSLPPLPPILRSFYCQDNQLTSLPPLPNTVRALYFQDNQISSLPAPLPDSLIQGNFSGNQMSCFPPLPTGSGYYITLFPNPATCLPNYGAWMQTWAAGVYLNEPLCVVGDPTINPANCANGTGIYGAVFQDNNTNCSFDGGDLGVPNIPLNLLDGSGNQLERDHTIYTGAYYFNPGVNATYTVEMDTTSVPFLSRICPGGYTQTATLSTGTPVVNGLDMDLDCNGSQDLGVQAINSLGIAFPGQSHLLKVKAGDFSQWYGFNCASGVTGQVAVTVTGPVSYDQPGPGALTPTVVGTTYSYAVSDFGTFDFNTSIGLQFTVDTTATAADTICVDVVLTSSATDLDPANNTLQFCYPVRNSYDPNEKETFPRLVEAGYEGWLNYTIHFQNTGNAPAFEIDLLDTLDSKLDLSTFEVVDYSHNNRAHLVGDELRVKFPNIQLPDSTSDYWGSMGYFSYRIKPQSGQPMGTEIMNTAHIFFDFNPAIVTNTTVNDFSLVTSRTPEFVNQVIKVFPNPSAGQFRLQWETQGTEVNIQVLNMMGQSMKQLTASGNQADLDLTDLQNGVYFLRLANQQGTMGQVRCVIAR